MSDYDKSSITILSDAEHIRKRHSMYIGDAVNPSPLFNEIVDNALDEAQVGFSKSTDIIVDLDNNRYTVIDHGRGFPQGSLVHPFSGKEYEVLELLCTTSNSGGKFDHSAYKLSTGLHGLGLLVTNALSKEFKVKTWRDSSLVVYEGAKGVTISLSKSSYPSGDSGTEVTFIPDEEMFDDCVIPINHIIMRCKVASAFGMKCNLSIVEDGVERKIDVESDIYNLLPDEDEGVSEYYRHSFTVKDEETGEYAAIALKYTSDTKSYYRGYTNLLYNSSGGTHHKMMDSAIYDAWNSFDLTGLKWNDIYLGLRAVVAVFISNTEFSSQSKEKLTTNKSYLEKLRILIKDEIVKWLKTNDDIRNSLLKRFKEYRASQDKLLARKEIKSLLIVNDSKGGSVRRTSVVRKLRECSSKSREGTELHICLSKDTKIRLADGRSLTVPELIEEDAKGIVNYTYSYDLSKGSMCIEKIVNPRQTSLSSKFVKLTFDNGEVLKCTLNHHLMKRDGSYVEAQDLNVGDAMMPAEFVTDDSGYEMIYDPDKGEYVYCHYLADEYNKRNNNLRDMSDDFLSYGNRYSFVRHHVDFNKTNNNPENVQRYSWKSHQLLHVNSPEWQSKRALTAWESPEYRSMKSKTMTEYNNKRWSNYEEELSKHKGIVGWDIRTEDQMKKFSEGRDEYNKTERAAEMRRNNGFKTSTLHPEQMINALLEGRRLQVKEVLTYLFTNGISITKENYELNRIKFGSSRKPLKWDTIFSGTSRTNPIFSSIEEMYNYVGIPYSNHKIVNIEFLEEEEPSYNITVENTHNYSLDCGIISKNCEGDSALGTIVRARDQRLQAVLPVRGKVLNVSRLENLNDALKNEEIRSIINSIGAGIGDTSDASKSRYDKIIFDTDADADGLEIRVLLSGIFIMLLPDLVKKGMVYTSIPPLYGWKDKSGYHFTNSMKDITSKEFYRYKGLGEMDPDELWESSLNPETRRLVRINYPEDINIFRSILTSSGAKFKMLEDCGVIKYEI